MKFLKDMLFDDTLELDLVYNTVPEALETPAGDLHPEKPYPVLPVKQFTKDEILALQDEIDRRNIR